MLFLLNRPDPAALSLVPALAGEEDAELLLISDGVYLAREAGLKSLSVHDFEEIYAEAKAVSDRGLKPDSGCEVKEMGEIVDLILDNEKVVNL